MESNKLFFCIQYDNVDGDHVFTYRCEADDVRDALKDFDRYYNGCRVLSVELIPMTKVNDFEYRFKAEQQMRDRAIGGLR